MVAFFRYFLAVTASMCATVFFVSAAAFVAGTFVFAHIVVSNLEPGAGNSDDPTYLSVALKDAEDIRLSLAAPVAVPKPLPPITEELAYGRFLKGRLPRVASNRQADARQLLRASAARDAMAMDADAVDLEVVDSRMLQPSPRSAYAAYDRHKVY